MTISYTIEPNPRWVIIDNFSKLPNGAAIYTFSNKNPSQFKPAFQNQSGLEFGQPIVGFGNGTMPPIFWKFDSDFPDEGYFIKVYSAKIEENGVLLWTFNNLFGGGGSGGGVITTNNDIENLVVNGQFFRNIGNQIGTPSLSTQITLAPSNHAEFVGYANNVNDGPVGPDIIFAKSGNTASDSLSFVNFTKGEDALGDNPTPEQFVQYTCTIAGTDQYRFIQFPIVKGLQNLSGETVAVKIWANFQSGNSAGVTMSLRQFFGNGGSPDLDVIVPLGSLDLVPGSWEETIFSNVTIPSVGGKNFGTCGNDALYLQLNLSPSSTIDIQFILPALFLDDEISPADFIDFNTLDRVESITNTPRTGDIRTTLNAFSPYGWVNMNDGTIGNALSNATSRRNVDTFPLFDLIWRTFQANQSLAPMFTSAAVATPYGANSFTDFDSNRAISLTRNLGRVMAGSLPVQVTQAFTTPIANILTVASTASFRANGVPVTVSGSTVPQLVDGTTYYARLFAGGTTMSLFRSAEDALATVNVITFPANGALGGTVILASHALGEFLGEETHTIIPTELPAGPFFVQVDGTLLSMTPGGTPFAGLGPPGGAVVNTNLRVPGGSQPMNVLQPTVFMNVFIKL